MEDRNEEKSIQLISSPQEASFSKKINNKSQEGSPQAISQREIPIDVKKEENPPEKPIYLFHEHFSCSEHDHAPAHKEPQPPSKFQGEFWEADSYRYEFNFSVFVKSLTISIVDILGLKALLFLYQLISGSKFPNNFYRFGIINTFINLFGWINMALIIYSIYQKTFIYTDAKSLSYMVGLLFLSIIGAAEMSFINSKIPALLETVKLSGESCIKAGSLREVRIQDELKRTILRLNFDASSFFMSFIENTAANAALFPRKLQKDLDVIDTNWLAEDDLKFRHKSPPIRDLLDLRKRGNGKKEILKINEISERNERNGVNQINEGNERRFESIERQYEINERKYQTNGANVINERNGVNEKIFESNERQYETNEEKYQINGANERKYPINETNEIINEINERNRRIFEIIEGQSEVNERNYRINGTNEISETNERKYPINEANEKNEVNEISGIDGVEGITKEGDRLILDQEVRKSDLIATAVKFEYAVFIYKFLTEPSRYDGQKAYAYRYARDILEVYSPKYPYALFLTVVGVIGTIVVSFMKFDASDLNSSEDFVIGYLVKGALLFLNAIVTGATLYLISEGTNMIWNRLCFVKGLTELISEEKPPENTIFRKLNPMINIFDFESLRTWASLRMIFMNMNQKRLDSISLAISIIVTIQLTTISILGFFYFTATDPIQKAFFLQYIIFFGTPTIIYMIFVLLFISIGAQVNNQYQEHIYRLKTLKITIYKLFALYPTFTGPGRIQPSTYLYARGLRCLQQLFEGKRITPALLKENLEIINEAYDTIITELEVEEQHRPMTLLGIPMTDSFAGTVFGTILTVVMIPVGKYLAEITGWD